MNIFNRNRMPGSSIKGAIPVIATPSLSKTPGTSLKGKMPGAFSKKQISFADAQRLLNKTSPTQKTLQAAPSRPPEQTQNTLASCEPSPLLRGRIAQDLNIKGEQSCPQKIDMRAIIPVYDFKPPENQQVLYEEITTGGAVNIGGLTEEIIPLSPRFIYLYTDLEVLHWILWIYFDIAGRAALAAANAIVKIAFQYVPGVGETPYPLGETAYLVGANAGQPGYIYHGNNQRAPQASTELFIGEIYYKEFYKSLETKDEKEFYQLSAQIHGGAAFPANSTLSLEGICRYKPHV